LAPIPTAKPTTISPNAFSGDAPINCLAFSHDRSTLAMGKTDNTIALWDLRRIDISDFDWQL